ncbi:GmrSD restriction endonuclease domain-containing protein [Pseudobacteriovorax antillogorgiicola]|uniref:Uncharacterized conserved protein, contains ParB-like and HNH nuclease domains n=1 Tax=Pseudobacteriovorax antillogorgiicola TaxID=1513793 RepID=A0A1Y6CV53_9BACT|nr:DUF262 domain-containing protein [Pseudobacteriovorax antillogorgiicola]TCS44205.1 uncharacterized protein with ParB-like and HNH nuclease domain [Pseudobacteriovorax antillogorgiicola]SMF80389.1 Uncharacterized conserved protein, contains ParB-like and HNH nuclease domains [Pseudobacteriovorax antillogorgiicola]
MYIKGEDRQISKILNSAFYHIPTFQRPYSWSKENIKELWNDVLGNGEENYFLGTMVVYRDGRNRYGIVDGQQRLTTITMMLAAIRNRLNSNRNENLAKGVHNLIEKPDIDNVLTFVVQTETSYPYFQQHIQRFGSPNFSGRLGKEEGTVKIAFELIVELLGEYLDSQIEMPGFNREEEENVLKSIRDKFLNATVIFIELDSIGDAYLIFETLNARGMPLDAADLVKNHLTRYLSNQNPKLDEVKDAWNTIKSNTEISKLKLDVNSFVLHFWISSNPYLTGKKLFKAVQDKISCFETARDLLNRLEYESKIYKKISNPESVEWSKEDSSIKESLNGLVNVFNVTQPHPFVLAVLAEYERRNIKSKLAKKSISLIERYHFASTALCSVKSSGGVSKMYASQAKAFRDAEGTNSKGVIVSKLEEKLLEKLPSREEFRSRFKDLEYSSANTKQKKTVRYILQKVLTELRPESCFDFESMTIEHLFPESRKMQGFQSIGNLLLLPAKLNNENLGNKPIRDKLTSLSSFPEFLDPSLKGEVSTFDIEKRSDTLCRILEKWVYGKLE